MDGRLQAYSDAGGVTPVSSGLIRRINEAGGTSWLSSSDAQRPQRDLGVRFDLFGTGTPGTQLQRAAQTVNMNDTTMVVQFTPRDGVGGNNQGLIGTSTNTIGAFSGSGILGGFVNGGPQQFGFAVPLGVKCSAVLRWTPTAFKGSMRAGGTTYTDTVTTAISSGTAGTNIWTMGNAMAGAQGLYGSIGQALVVNRAVTDAEVAQLLAWADAISATDAYPVTAPLVGVCGDSITRGVGVANYQAWAWLMLGTLRTGSFPTLEECNVGIAGSGVSPTMYAALTPFYSASRAKNVVVLASGTNDIATGVAVATVTASYFAACAALRAQGWKVVACTILPRSDTMTVSQATFDAGRATLNANIIAGSANYDALANVATVTGMGADGDSNNATNYQADKVHPTAAGHALIEPTYRTAISSLL